VVTYESPSCWAIWGEEVARGRDWLVGVEGYNSERGDDFGGGWRGNPVMRVERGVRNVAGRGRSGWVARVKGR